MSHRIRLSLASLATTALLLFGATASARRLETTTQQFRIVWNSLEYRFEELPEAISCPTTMEGSFHSRTLSKVSGQLVGYVTRIALQPCVGGQLSVLTETLPWHLQYNSFRGTLPRITEINYQMLGAGWWFEAFGVTCLYRSTQANPMGLIGVVEGGNLRLVRLDETKSIPGLAGFPCPPAIKFSGSGEAFVQGSTSTRIGIRLVS